MSSCQPLLFAGLECTEVFIFMFQLLDWRSVAVAVIREGLIEEHNPGLLKLLDVIL